MRAPLALLVVAACVTGEPEAPATQAVPMHEAMREHVTRLNAANRALVDSEVAAARAELAWIAEHPVANDALAPYAKAHLDAMQEHARAGAAAPGVPGVAQAVGRIAEQCGACHTKARIGPKVSGREPPQGHGVKGSMRRYEWAANTMVEGLIVGDAQTWARASHVIFVEPLDDVKKPDGSPAPPEVEAFTRRMAELGLEGQSPAGIADRGALYGEFVATCAACHAATDGGPGAAAERAKGEGGE